MRAQALPPYRAMLAVDMKDFSGNQGREHEALTALIPQIVASAFTRAGLGSEWAEGQRFPRPEGDGYVVGFRPSVLPFLVNPLLQALQAELAERNATDSTPRQTPIRMRVGINVGPVTDSGENPVVDGSGAARVETHRLLEAPVVKDLLERSAPETYVAAIIGARAFEDAVLTGYSGDSEKLYISGQDTDTTRELRRNLLPKSVVLHAPAGDCTAGPAGLLPGETTVVAANRRLPRIQISPYSC